MRQAIALLAAVFLVAAGACLFDAGEQPGHDLCSALAVTPVPLAAFVLLPAGQIPPPAVFASLLFHPDLPAPPPRA